MLLEPSAPGGLRTLLSSEGPELSASSFQAPSDPRRLPGRTSFCGFSLADSVGGRPGEGRRAVLDPHLQGTGFTMGHCPTVL